MFLDKEVPLSGDNILIFAVLALRHSFVLEFDTGIDHRNKDLSLLASNLLSERDGNSFKKDWRGNIMS